VERLLRRRFSFFRGRIGALGTTRPTLTAWFRLESGATVGKKRVFALLVSSNPYSLIR
jgi:hypothetical protein